MLKYLILFAVCSFFMSTTYSSSYMKSVNINCTGNKKYIFPNFTCRLKAINRYKAVGMLQLLIRKPLRNISFNFAVYVRNGANVFKPFIINVTENMCSWYNRKTPSPYAVMIKRVLRQFTNINHSCPYTGTLIGRNLYLDMSMVPVPLPKNSYKFEVIFLEGIQSYFELIGTVTFYMDLIES